MSKIDLTKTEYHDKYIKLYKQLSEKYSESNYPEIKNFCLVEMRRIKNTWINTYELNPTELEQYEPKNIAV